LPRLIAIGVEIADDEIGRGEGDEEGIFPCRIGGPGDGLARALARDPNRRMRRLIRPRPAIDVADVVMLTFEGEGTGLRPSLNDEIMRFMKALMREIRIDAGRVIFGANAAHEAADDAAAREIVEHRVFFGDVHWIALQRQSAAEDRDLDLLGALDERAGD